MSQLLLDIENLIGPVLEQNNIELVDLSYQKTHNGMTLSLYLDKPGGISLDDCAHWSNEVGTILDGTELLKAGYNLEVSSPGIDRPLRKMSDFEKFKGQKVSVKLFAPMNGQKNFHGILLGATEEFIEIQEEGSKGNVSLPRTQVAKAKLNPDIDF